MMMMTMVEQPDQGNVIMKQDEKEQKKKKKASFGRRASGRTFSHFPSSSSSFRMTTPLLCFLLVLISFGSTIVVVSAQNDNDNQKYGQDEYILVGVSGGLQKAFPDTVGLHHADHPQSRQQPPIFLGRALVRGYKSYLDVMQPSWRQYVEPTQGDTKDTETMPSYLLGSQQQPLINCNVIPTGCWHDANEYWVYLVALPQFHRILMNEPRFLSIAPDHGLVDLTADETGALVQHVAQYFAKAQQKTDLQRAAIPLVTGTWFNAESHVPSPILYVKPDGTRVFNFPDSLALWAGGLYDNDSRDPNDNNHKIKRDCQPRQGPVDAEVSCVSPTEIERQEYQSRSTTTTESTDTSTNDSFFYFAHYWKTIWTAIRNGEAHRPPQQQEHDAAPWAQECAKQARFGVSPDMARVNEAQTRSEWNDILATYKGTAEDRQRGIRSGSYIDWEQGRVVTLKAMPYTGDDTNKKDEL